MKKHLKLLTASLVLAQTLASPQASHGMEHNNGPNDIPKPVKAMIFEYAARDTNPGTLRLVCKNWKGIIDKDTEIDDKGIRYTTIGPVWKRCVNAWYGMTDHEAILQKFLNGKLIYRPIEGSDEGMIELNISDLKNPFEGTFDLSKCGEAGQSLSISTGYRKKNNPENATKVEIWICLRSMMEKSGRYTDILKNGSEETEPFVLLWNGGWEELGKFDCLSDKSPEFISAHTSAYLFALALRGCDPMYISCRMTGPLFHVHFMN